MRSGLIHFAQGLLMGGSDAIPGVSGGTMALIVGIYRRLIDAISGFVSLVLATVRFDRAERRRLFHEVEWNLLLPLGAGLLVAFGVATQVIPYLLDHFPEQMRGLFFGLVLASVAIPWMRIRRARAWHALLVVLFAAAAYFLVGLPQGSATDPSLLRVFLSTSVAICAMILPGVSGAYLLKALGVYEGTLQHVGHLDVLYILAFFGGAAFGLAAFSKLLDWLLSKRHDATMAALTGLMAGALRALWPWQTPGRVLQLPGPGDALWSVVALAVAGFAFIVVITWLGAARLQENPDEAEATSEDAPADAPPQPHEEPVS